MATGSAASTTVRLYPLAPEHTPAMMGDLVFLALLYGTWKIGLGRPDTYASDFGQFAAILAFHAAQMAVVAVRFDDTAITISRLWRRRRRVEWSRVAGLIYTQGIDTNSKAPYRLRLVIKGHEPPLGRYVADAEIARIARGPVVMAVTDLPSARRARPDNRSVRCQDRVYAELERHGFPRPEPRTLAFRSPRYTPEQTQLARAVDQLRLHAVTVTHGNLADEHDVELVGTVLPKLARTVGPGPAAHRADGYTIFMFEGPAAGEAAAAFLPAAREVVPAGWRVDPGALPEGDPRG